MSSIAGDNGVVQIFWHHGGTEASFSGFERLTEKEFLTLNYALMNDGFLTQVQDWSNKDEFVRKLKGKHNARLD